MAFLDKNYTDLEYITMVFYILLSVGVVAHWIHVWVGKPDNQVGHLNFRLKALEDAINDEEKAITQVMRYRVPQPSRNIRILTTEDCGHRYPCSNSRSIEADEKYSIGHSMHGDHHMALGGYTPPHPLPPSPGTPFRRRRQGGFF
ncbi:hypothetical protein K490DRAFT_69134 [Saccharata proteae CBS 121410]|uniref:Uncharacterized protein n=1 Tax=Saccharata proteae CBS 121410 TaxID=1314787 RepID=A0A9P4LTS0_9PEZI|nr:hypothetical protein K490DRAFT_69134 [Saccharata proteae CBS 121410]